MPYTVVETTAVGGSKKTMVVPATWVVPKNDRIGFVYWPNETDEKNVKELIADDRSKPLAQWERKVCNIIFRSIPSLATAEKALAIRQKLSNAVAKEVTPTTRSIPNAVPNPQTTAQAKDPFDKPAPKLPTKPVAKTSYAGDNDLFGGFFKVTSGNKWLGENSSYRSKLPNTEQDLENLPPQLYNLLDEIKRQIISNQEELKQKMQEGFSEMRKLFTSLTKQTEPVESCDGGQTMKTPGDGFTFKKLMTINEVKQFDERLANAMFRKNVYSWIDSAIGHEYIARKRMKVMVELVFDERLFAQFSWSGMYNKPPLKQYLNIRKLMQHVATTPSHQSNQNEVKFLLLKMMNSGDSKGSIMSQKAADSLTNDLVEQRCTAPTVRLSVKNVENVADQRIIFDENEIIALDIIVEDEEAMELEEIIENEQIIQPANPDESIEQDKGAPLQSEQTKQTKQTDEGSSTEVNINRITCLDELNMFENELKDPEMQRMLHKWIDSTVVNREPNVGKRLNTLLDRLMDGKVLQSLSWMNTKSTKRPLNEYKNFVRLFEYASKTVIHQTVIYNHGCVANFFAKRLRES